MGDKLDAQFPSRDDNINEEFLGAAAAIPAAEALRVRDVEKGEKGNAYLLVRLVTATQAPPTII